MNVAVILLFAVCVVILETGSRVQGKIISFFLSSSFSSSSSSSSFYYYYYYYYYYYCYYYYYYYYIFKLYIFSNYVSIF